MNPRLVPSAQEMGPPSAHLGGPPGHGGRLAGLGSDPSRHLGETPPAQVGLPPSLQAPPLVAVEPSEQTQLGLVPSPQGLRRFCLRVFLLTTFPLLQVQVGWLPSPHLGLMLLKRLPRWALAPTTRTRTIDAIMMVDFFILVQW